jgi:hypothetical protein
MSDRIIPALSISCGALTLMYMVLMVMTISFATWQTESVNSVRSAESAIGTLEANYYTAMNHASSLNPATLGYVAPTQVEYVAEATSNSSNLTFAGN